MSSTKQPSREWPLYEGTTHQQLDAVKNCLKQHLSPKGYEYAMEYLTTGTDGTSTRNGLCVKLCELIEPGFKAMIEFTDYKERRLTAQTYFTTSEMRQLSFDYKLLIGTRDLILVPNSRGVRVLVHKELPKAVPKSALDITSLSFGRLVQQGVAGPVQLHIPLDGTEQVTLTDGVDCIFAVISKQNSKSNDTNIATAEVMRRWLNSGEQFYTAVKLMLDTMPLSMKTTPAASKVAQQLKMIEQGRR